MTFSRCWRGITSEHVLGENEEIWNFGNLKRNVKKSQKPHPESKFKMTSNGRFGSYQQTQFRQECSNERTSTLFVVNPKIRRFHKYHDFRPKRARYIVVSLNSLSTPSIILLWWDPDPHRYTVRSKEHMKQWSSKENFNALVCFQEKIQMVSCFC